VARRGSIDAVVFDFDGVLADTERLHFGAFRDVFARRGWTLSERDYFTRYLGHGDAALIEAFARDQGHRLAAGDADTLFAEKSVAFRSGLSAGGVLYPGAAECVRDLAARFPLAIASGALRAEIVDVLAAHDLAGCFRAIVAIEDVTHGKPDPEPFALAASRLGLQPSACVAVEDSRWGLEAARAAGMRVIAVTTSTPAGDLAAADRIVARIDEITVDLVAALAPGEARVLD
jgi:HAD superfamily hydrolase (TIGR01509 family)